MKFTSSALAGLFLLSLTSIALIACHGADTKPAASSAAPDAEMLNADVGGVSLHVEGVPGGVTTHVAHIAAKVSAVDYAKRTVTLVDDSGNKKMLQVGPAAVNFNQVKVGDLVNATYAEELVIFLRAKGAPNNDGAAGVVAAPPVGDKPGLFTASTVEVTAIVKSVDIAKHTATLQFPDGSSETVAVRPDVDLTKAKTGEEVVMRMTTAIAISVDKP